MSDNKEYKKTILIDLDGVLNTYTGNFDKRVIPPMKKGAKEFLEKLYKNYDLRLFTTRNKLLASKWLIENEIDKYFSDITNVKEISFLIIDDRCIKFTGDYKELTENIEDFKPWYKE